MLQGLLAKVTNFGRPPAPTRETVKTVPVGRPSIAKTPAAVPKLVVSDGKSISPLDSNPPAALGEDDTNKPVTVFTQIGEVPSFAAVLTTENGKIPLGKPVQAYMVALLLNDKSSVLVICAPEFPGTLDHLSLVERIKAAKYKMQDVALGTPTLIADIYSAAARRAERASIDVEELVVETAESVRRFNDIVQFGADVGATDIHIEIRRDSGRVLYRVNGVIEAPDNRRYEAQALTEVISVAYTKLADKNTHSHTHYKDNDSQDCVIDWSAQNGRSYRIRYQKVSVVGGSSTVLRMLTNEAVDAREQTLEELGYAPTQIEQLILAGKRSVGLNLVVGGTGSGKSTTLKTLLTMSPRMKKLKTYSIEDPAEYRIRNVAQMSVPRSADTSKDNPFIPAMRVIMRADPDVIMVGEIRDVESASLLTAMVQSGHRVYATLHSSSTFATIARICSPMINISRGDLASRTFLSSLTHQSLLRELCPHCRQKATKNLPARRLRLIESKFHLDPEAINVINEAGCDHCRGGIIGRTVAAEIFTPTPQLLKLIRDGHDNEAEEVWRGSRWAPFDDEDCTGKTAFEHALFKMSQGRIDPMDIEEAYEAFETYWVMPIAETAKPTVSL